MLTKLVDGFGQETGYMPLSLHYLYLVGPAGCDEKRKQGGIPTASSKTAGLFTAQESKGLI
jgi:hypothetical protein